MINRLWVILLTTVFFSDCQLGLADSHKEPDSPFSFDLSVGIERDSNLLVSEIDVVSRKSDFLGFFDAEIDYEKMLGNTTEFSASYDFFQTIHEQYSDYNLQIHSATARVNHEFSRISGTLAYNYIYSSLDGSSFLAFHRISPSASGFLSKSLFVRSAFDFTSKDFDKHTERDSTVLSPTLGVYFLVNGRNTYVYARYRYVDEDADDSQYSFSGHSLRVGLTHRLSFLNRPSKLRLGVRFRDRDYVGVTNEIGKARRDQRGDLDLSFEIQLNRGFYCTLEYGYKDNSSNLEDVDYDEQVASFRIGKRF